MVEAIKAVEGVEVIRMFVAVTLDPELVPGVAAIRDRLTTPGADVKWVEEENLHFTLKFLGEVPAGDCGLVAQKVGEAAPQLKAFEIVLAGVGAFPSVGNPRAIWVGVREGAQGLVDLAGRIEDALAGGGFPADKRGFSPHLTLGRLRSPRGVGGLSREISVIQKDNPVIGKMKVEAVKVMKSLLTRQGPIYTPLAVVELATDGQIQA